MSPDFKVSGIRKMMDDQTTLSSPAKMTACTSAVRKFTEGRLPSSAGSFDRLQYLLPN